MATNFDAWKESLTPDEALDVYGARRFCGIICPAKDYCQPHSRQIQSLTRRCKEKFFEWAAKEAATC